MHPQYLVLSFKGFHSEVLPHLSNLILQYSFMLVLCGSTVGHINCSKHTTLFSTTGPLLMLFQKPVNALTVHIQTGLFHCIPLYFIAYHRYCSFLQIEGLWQPCVEQAYR